jgi:hypothetical protein
MTEDNMAIVVWVLQERDPKEFEISAILWWGKYQWESGAMLH